MNVYYGNNIYTITLQRNGKPETHVFKDLEIQLTDWSSLPVPANCRYFIDARPSFETFCDYDKMRIVFLESKEELDELRRLMTIAKKSLFVKFVHDKYYNHAELPGEHIM